MHYLLYKLLYFMNIMNFKLFKFGIKVENEIHVIQFLFYALCVNHEIHVFENMKYMKN